MAILYFSKRYLIILDAQWETETNKLILEYVLIGVSIHKKVS